MRCSERRAFEARKELAQIPTEIDKPDSPFGARAEKLTDEEACRIWARVQRARFSRKPGAR